jgi:hypothetical protein
MWQKNYTTAAGFKKFCGNVKPICDSKKVNRQTKNVIKGTQNLQTYFRKSEVKFIFC